MTDGRSVRVLVRSRRVPVRTTVVQTPLYFPFGRLVQTAPRQEVVYESVYDEPQLRAIDEARRLSCNLGLQLRVVDATKSGVFNRFLSTMLGIKGPLLILPDSPHTSEPCKTPEGAITTALV